MLYYKDAGYEEKERIGLATKNFEVEKFEAVANFLENLFEGSNKQISELMELKLRASLAAYRGQIDVMRNFSNKIVDINGKAYELNVYLLEKMSDTELATCIELPWIS